MKKIIILIIIILIVIGVLFTYNYLGSDNKLRELETNQLIPIVSTQEENYFLMYIDEVSNDNSNINIKGTVYRGNIKINDEISIVGLGKKEIVTNVLKIKNSGEEKETANEGDIINIVLESNLPENYIVNGQAVIKTGTTKPIYNITAIINSISTESILELEKKANAFSINKDIKCSVKVLKEESNEVNIILDVPIVIDAGIEISLKDNDKVIAKGVVLNQ